MKALAIALSLFALALSAQSPNSTKSDPWASLHFLEGTWQGNTQGSSVAASGVSTFVRELNGHVLARHSSSDPGCKGPATFDCAHSDLLYIYETAPAQNLKAIYFDNEGHVIHYDISAPAPNTVVFLSEPGPGPRFRLTYELKNSVMSGKFQSQMPGETTWTSYLEWSGPKK
jgi:hypothetical protein